MGENPHFCCIFDVFCPYLKNWFSDYDEILRLNSLIDTKHLTKTACPKKIWFGLYGSRQTPFLRLKLFFFTIFVWYHVMTGWYNSLNDLKFGQDVR